MYDYIPLDHWICIALKQNRERIESGERDSIGCKSGGAIVTWPTSGGDSTGTTRPQCHKPVISSRWYVFQNSENAVTLLTG